VEIRHIVRLAATELKGDMPIKLALTKVPGVSFMFSNAVIKALNLDSQKPVGALSDAELEKIEDCLRNPQNYGIPAWMYNRRKDLWTGKDMHIVGPELRLSVKQDIDFMKKIKSYRGIRHALGLKVRGQRTKSTGRKGRTVGVQRKKR